MAPTPLLLWLLVATLLGAACVEVFPDNGDGGADAVRDPAELDSTPGDTTLPDGSDADSTTTDPAPDLALDSDPGDGFTSDLEVAGCPNDCAVPPNDCFTGPGTCEDGECEFTFRGVGAECDDGNPCTEGDECDDFGECVGVGPDCDYPHTTGSFCLDGECQGWSCADGWDDCNDDLGLDGCERSLDTLTDCGECDLPCSSRPNSVADCSTGECLRTCVSPWENCDGDWSNGCEIPTEVANQCDVDGLNPTTGCWTAHCGTLDHPDARNFGTWFCFECTTCHVPASGRCQWCSHSVGEWFPDDACACGLSQDLTCEP